MEANLLYSDLVLVDTTEQILCSCHITHGAGTTTSSSRVFAGQKLRYDLQIHDRLSQKTPTYLQCYFFISLPI
jgi:hypothetical protein